MVDRLQPEFANKVDFMVYGAVNSDQAGGEFAGKQGVTAIPTMVIVSADGTEIDRLIGGTDEQGLRDFIGQAQ